jgi:hypothetical protein
VGSKLDPSKAEIRRLLADDAALTGQRIRADRAVGVRWWQDDRR